MNRPRWTVTGLVALLLVAACGGGTGDAGTTTTTTAGATTGSTTSSSTTSSTTTTTVAAPEPVELTFEEAPPSADPLETILPLDGVTVSMNADGAYVLTFAESMYGGLSARLLGLADGEHVVCSWWAEADFEGEGEGTGCFSQTQAGYVGDPPYANGDAPTMSLVLMVEVTADSISLTVGDTTFTGTGLSVDDGPLFVQIDPNTGGLAEPVTRRTGIISASDLFAAING